METTYRHQLLAFDSKLRELTNCPMYAFTHFYYWQLMEPFPLSANANPFIRDIESEEVIELVVDLAACKRKTITKENARKSLQESFEAMTRTRVVKDKRFASLPISNAMRCKLRRRYSGKDFEQDLWRMLYRYETLALVANENMQLSILDNEYEKLRESGYQYECFASPLNCHLDHFFSAFPDTDSVFGSLGNFFQNYSKIPTDAKCTLDPPYQLHLMNKAIAIAFAYPATFRVVVVAWRDADYYKELKEKSDSFIEYPKSEKEFILHQANGKRFIKPSDTVIAIVHERK